MPFRIPPTGEQESSNYAFSISANGTVYFARSDESNPCGTVDLVSRAVRARYWLELDRLPPDLGISSTYTASRPGWTSVYFTRGLGCGDNPDAYALDLREFSGRQAAG